MIDDKGELAKLYEKSICDINEGDVIQGTVVQVGSKDVLVDIGYKSEGIVHKYELIDPDNIRVGDKLDVFLEIKENDMGMVVLSHEKAKKLKGWQKIVDKTKEGDSVDGRIVKKVRGGFMVDIGLEAFLPASLSAMQDISGGDNLVGTTCEFKIVKINIPRKNIVLSRKEIIDEMRKEEKRVMLDQLKKDDIVKGSVRNITDFGAFIDIGGGVTGLLHITDMSWGRVTKPADVLKVGDEIDVKVLNFDKISMKVSLGLKQKTQNPWDGIDEKYPEGSVVKGKVVNIMPYGVFVEIDYGVEGLIHISEFSWSKKYNHPSEKFHVGDNVEAIVLKVDKNNRKLSLGLKQLEGNPWENAGDKYKVGDRVKGIVNTIVDYGIFVKLDEGIEGLVHVSDLSWTKRIAHPKELVKKGEEIEAVVLNVDAESRRIALGIKQLTLDPWDEIVKRFSPGAICDGLVANITNFGLFVSLEKDLEGLLHVSEMTIKNGEKINDYFKTGDKIRVKVIHIDGVQKKIALSVKDVN